MPGNHGKSNDEIAPGVPGDSRRLVRKGYSVSGDSRTWKNDEQKVKGEHPERCGVIRGSEREEGRELPTDVQCEISVVSNRDRQQGLGSIDVSVNNLQPG